MTIPASTTPTLLSAWMMFFTLVVNQCKLPLTLLTQLPHSMIGRSRQRGGVQKTPTASEEFCLGSYEVCPRLLCQSEYFSGLVAGYHWPLLIYMVGSFIDMTCHS